MMRVVNLKQAAILKRKQRRCKPIRKKYEKTRPLFILSGLVFLWKKKAVSRSQQLEIYEVNIQK